jgi:hypothetical protein
VGWWGGLEGRIFGKGAVKLSNHLFLNYLVINYNAVLAGLVHLGHHNGSLPVVILVEAHQLLEGKVTDDVTVEDEEGLLVLAEDLLGEGEGAGCSQRLLLVREGDLDAQPGCLNLKINRPNLRYSASAVDPDPHLVCLGSPGSVSYKYGSGSGTFHRQAKIFSKTLVFYCFVTSL